MSKITILFLSLLLSGCFATVPPVKQKFPEVPELLLKKCDQLKTIEGNTATLAQFLQNVTQNYGLFHECSALNEAWVDWYNKQKEIYNNR